MSIILVIRECWGAKCRDAAPIAKIIPDEVAHGGGGGGGEGGDRDGRYRSVRDLLIHVQSCVILTTLGEAILVHYDRPLN